MYEQIIRAFYGCIAHPDTPPPQRQYCGHNVFAYSFIKGQKRLVVTVSESEIYTRQHVGRNNTGTVVEDAASLEASFAWLRGGT